MAVAPAPSPAEQAEVVPPTFPTDLFWSKVKKTETCWLWTGLTRGGYGVMMHRRKNHVAHRVAWFLTGRAVPDGRVLDHLCRNRACVNPEHLEPVSNRENVLRGVGRTAANARKDRCDKGHDLSGDNLVIKRKGAARERACRECTNARARVSNARPITCPCGTTVRASNLRRHQQAHSCIEAA